MKPFLFSLFLAAVSADFTPAGEVSFYVGTFTKSSASKGIYLAKLNTDTGALSHPELAAEAIDPSFLVFSPDGRFLYAGLENQGGAVGAFQVGPQGALTPLNRAASGGAGACHVSMDSGGRHLFVAHYNSGNIACFDVNADGSLGTRTAFTQFSGPNGEQSRAHWIGTGPGDQSVYACDFGTDRVWIFDFDSKTGQWTPHQPPSAPTPPGSGPRHLAFHPSGEFVYVCNEKGLSVTVFKRDRKTGSLTGIQTISTLPGVTEKKGLSTAEILIHPSGPWLYVSNRGDDSISLFSLGGDGKLVWIENVPAEVRMPRSLAIDPSGKWMLAAGQQDNRVSVFKIDPATGKLTATQEFMTVPSPTCLVFAPKKP